MAAAQATARNGRDLPSQSSAGEGAAVAALRAQEEAEDEARAAADAAWSMFEKARALESRCSERGRAGLHKPPRRPSAGAASGQEVLGGKWAVSANVCAVRSDLFVVEAFSS